MPIAEGGRWSPEERIVSPGVFTRENDLMLTRSMEYSGAIIAPFPRDLLSPTPIENQTDRNLFRC